MAERPTPDPMSPVMRAALLRGLTSRRALVSGALGLGATAALAACGSEGTASNRVRLGAPRPRPPPRT